MTKSPPSEFRLIVARASIGGASLLAFAGALYIWLVATPGQICPGTPCRYLGPPGYHVISLEGVVLLATLSLLAVIPAVVPRLWFVGTAAGVGAIAACIWLQLNAITTPPGSWGSLVGSTAIIIGGILAVVCSVKIRRPNTRAAPVPSVSLSSN